MAPAGKLPLDLVKLLLGYQSREGVFDYDPLFLWALYGAVRVRCPLLALKARAVVEQRARIDRVLQNAADGGAALTGQTF